MNLNNITTALKTGITIYQYEQWQNTGSVNLMQKESHMLSNTSNIHYEGGKFPSMLTIQLFNLKF